MRSAVIVFPASNCDRDVAVAIEKISGTKPHMVWHKDTELPDVDLIVLPGGFSYGDYLRCGAMANQSPIMKDVVKRASAGTPTLGICNGFQILAESGLLPGVLMRNAGLHFVCRTVSLKVENADTVFTRKYGAGQTIRVPVAHHDGNYFADADTLSRLEGEGRVAFRYDNDNPNGSLNDIAGIVNEAGNVLGLMPHPERVADPKLGGMDGAPLFQALTEALS
jgi:phosphoribosylformylglycinamidine synthase I